MGRQAVGVVCVVFVLLGASCAGAREAAPTPFPSLEPISEFLARLTPRPSPATSASPSASAGSSAGGSARTTTNAGPAGLHHTTASGKLYCPSGQVTADIDDVHAQDTGRDYRNGDRRWHVTASGTAYNNTSGSVKAVQLAVTVHAPNEHPATVGATVGQTVGPGGSAQWSTSFEYRSARQPASDASVTVTGWSWANSSQAGCPA